MAKPKALLLTSYLNCYLPYFAIHYASSRSVFGHKRTRKFPPISDDEYRTASNSWLPFTIDISSLWVARPRRHGDANELQVYVWYVSVLKSCSCWNVARMCSPSLATVNLIPWIRVITFVAIPECKMHVPDVTNNSHGAAEPQISQHQNRGHCTCITVCMWITLRGQCGSRAHPVPWSATIPTVLSVTTHWG